METGFSDSRYLNTVFEKTFGFSVTDYRNRYIHLDMPDDPSNQSSHTRGGRYSRQECIRMVDEHLASGGFRY